MPVPSYDRFIEPVLRYLAARPMGAPAHEVHEAAAERLGLSASDRAELLPSGIQPVYKNRAGWAHDRLKRAGLSASPKRGFWKLTDAGVTFAKEHPEPLAADVLDHLVNDYVDVRIGPARPPGVGDTGRTPVPDMTSPDERLESALGEIRRAVADELLEILRQLSPRQFEAVVLEVLYGLGYGTSRDDLQRVGRAGDGGIDGIISLDRLGLEKVYVQAKRWQQPVGRPEIQGFYGALAGRRARKGVFITTSTFTPQALEFVQAVEGVVLVDGVRLADLMMEHEIGVTLRTVKVPKVDRDFFES